MSEEAAYRRETLEEWSKGALIELLLFFRNVNDPEYVKIRHAFENWKRGD